MSLILYVIYVNHFLKVCNNGAFIIWVGIMVYRIFQELTAFLSDKCNLRVVISSTHQNMCYVITVTLRCKRSQSLELLFVNYALDSDRVHLHKLMQGFKIMFMYVTLAIG
jgi:hypothetical protein